MSDKRTSQKKVFGQNFGSEIAEKKKPVEGGEGELKSVGGAAGPASADACPQNRKPDELVSRWDKRAIGGCRAESIFKKREGGPWEQRTSVKSA